MQLAGRAAEAQRLLDFIAARFLRADGDSAGGDNTETTRGHHGRGGPGGVARQPLFFVPLARVTAKGC
jgi:hypothetical protein